MFSKTITFQILLISILLYPGSFLIAQTTDRKIDKIEIDLLKNDIDFLVENIQIVHPNPFTFISKNEFYAEAEKLKSKITEPLTTIEYYCLITPLVVKIEDGHTRVEDLRNEFNHYKKNNGKIFPIDVIIDNSCHVIVSQVYSETELKIGDTIQTINSIPVTGIVDELIQYCAGETQRYRRYLVQQKFAYLLWIAYDFNPEKWDIETNKNIFKVNGITESEKRESKVSKEKWKILEYKNLGNNIGLLVTRGFWYNSEEYKTILKECFQQIKNDSITDLVIDNRTNEGGSSELAGYLVDYIYDKQYSHGTMEWKKSEPYDKWVREKYSGFMLFMFRLTPYKPYFKADYGDIVTVKWFDSKPTKNKIRFKGNLYVLAGKQNFSEGTGFVCLVKDYNMGTIIGEETGSVVNSFGDMFFYLLPNSKLEISTSIKRNIRPSGDRTMGKGVIPDIEVSQNIEDTKKGIDTVLEFTKDYIINNR